MNSWCPVLTCGCRWFCWGVLRYYSFFLFAGCCFIVELLCMVSDSLSGLFLEKLYLKVTWRSYGNEDPTITFGIHLAISFWRRRVKVRTPWTSATSLITITKFIPLHPSDHGDRTSYNEITLGVPKFPPKQTMFFQSKLSASTPSIPASVCMHTSLSLGLTEFAKSSGDSGAVYRRFMLKAMLRKYQI